MAQEEFALEFIHNIRKQDRGLGGTKLWLMYKNHFKDNYMGRDRFASLIDRNHLKVRAKIRKPRTTDSSHGLPVYPNLVIDLIPTRPNQLWVSDITYITIWKNSKDYTFCYLSLLQDAYTKEIIGWSVGSTLDTIYPMQALKMGLKRLDGKENIDLIHHSDRGCQYASGEYINILKTHDIRISMTESGNPHDNAMAERINNTIKNEFFKGITFYNIDQVKNEVASAVDFYNNKRLHMSLNMMTPIQATHFVGEISYCWKSYRSIAIKKIR